jgi:hypothetical protein
LGGGIISIYIGTKFYKGKIISKKADIRNNLDSMLNVLSRSKGSMLNPKMMHFVCPIEDFDILPKKFIQDFKEKFESEWRKDEKSERRKALRSRRLPKIEMIYSIEAKDIKNPNYYWGDAENSHVTFRYNHVHIMLIVDIGHKRYGWREISVLANKALNRINGIQSLTIEDDFTMTSKDGEHTTSYGFLKPRSRKCIFNNGEKVKGFYWHDLKTEFDDAVIRASYLCKSEQKALLPERFASNSFNVTRAARVAS